MFKISVTEIPEPRDGDTRSPLCFVRYEQTVDTINLDAIFAAVNRRPRKQRTPKAKANGNE